MCSCTLSWMGGVGFETLLRTIQLIHKKGLLQLVVYCCAEVFVL